MTGSARLFLTTGCALFPNLRHKAAGALLFFFGLKLLKPKLLRIFFFAGFRQRAKPFITDLTPEKYRPRLAG